MTCSPPFFLSLIIEGLLTSLILEPTLYKMSNTFISFIGRIPMLKGPNYQQWAPLVTGYLRTISAWYAITTSMPAEEKDENNKVTNQTRINHWHDANDKCLGTFTMTIDSALIYPYQDKEDTSDVWDALKEKFSTFSTTSKYLEFKVMYNTTIPEDSHPQAAFVKIHRHLDLLRDYQCEVSPFNPS